MLSVLADIQCLLSATDMWSQNPRTDAITHVITWWTNQLWPVLSGLVKSKF